MNYYLLSLSPYFGFSLSKRWIVSQESQELKHVKGAISETTYATHKEVI